MILVILVQEFSFPFSVFIGSGGTYSPLPWNWKNAMEVKKGEEWDSRNNYNEAIRSIKSQPISCTNSCYYAIHTVDGIHSEIRRQVVQGNNFFIRPTTIQMLQSHA